MFLWKQSWDTAAENTGADARREQSLVGLMLVSRGVDNKEVKASRECCNLRAKVKYLQLGD